LLEIASNSVDAQSLEAGCAGNFIKRCRAMKGGVAACRAFYHGASSLPRHGGWRGKSWATLIPPHALHA